MSQAFPLPLLTRWMDDGRNMRLISPFTYVRNGDPPTAFTVPQGFTTDGASIPRFFWRVIGGPLEGPYRRAAVVHDFLCTAQTIPSPDAHRVFYDACLDDGCPKWRATLMYWAVRFFGPRWETRHAE